MATEESSFELSESFSHFSFKSSCRLVCTLTTFDVFTGAGGEAAHVTPLTSVTMVSSLAFKVASALLFSNNVFSLSSKPLISNCICWGWLCCWLVTWLNWTSEILKRIMTLKIYTFDFYLVIFDCLKCLIRIFQNSDI